MKKLVFSSLLLSVFLVMGCKKSGKDLKDGLYADIQTSKGDIWVSLAYKKAPMTVANFVGLSKGTLIDSGKYAGKPFYDSLKFHRVISKSLIQAGDPTGTGSGDPGYTFPNEIVQGLKNDKKGMLGMANSGPGTNGSQFYITLKPMPMFDGQYSVFGHVLDSTSQGIADSIKLNDMIKTIKIVAVGKSAKAFNAKKTFTEKMAPYKAVQTKELNFFKNDLLKKVKALPSGVKVFWVNQDKKAKKPAFGTQVGVSYSGYLEDGKLFDSSDKTIAKENGKFEARREKMGAYGPMPLKYTKDMRLIPGFKEVLLKMHYGDQVWAIIPPKLAYGKRGAGKMIPPNSTLYFLIKLEKLKKK